ncbi:T9SS type A sorting domain-containing protein, partial [candidate division KSB1 bacterium]|nr:T9SS type A sorting domain-containing protein [candidate division KSB1 bacterium]
ITSSDTISTRKNEEFIYTASAIDLNGNELFYIFNNYPSWLSATDSILTGNVPSTASDTSFTLLVSDGELKDSIKVIITVYEPSLVSTLTIPSHFQLSENYPNPFNPTTNIKIELPLKTNLELIIYDINGKLVQELYNGQLNAGVYILTWNATNFPSGIYFIRCKSNRFNHVVKCTLLK